MQRFALIHAGLMAVVCRVIWSGTVAVVLPIASASASTETTVSFSSPFYPVSLWSNDLTALADEKGLAGPYTVFVDADCTLSASRCFGAGVCFQLQPGAQIGVDVDQILTIHSPAHVKCPAAQMAFAPLEGAKVVFTAGGVVNPGWWGAVPDANADHTAGIQAALDAAQAANGGTVVLFGGTYVVDGLTLGSNTILTGMAGATLRLRDGAFGSIVTAEGKENITVENLVLDMNGANQGDPNVPVTKRGLHLRSVGNACVMNCRFVNLFEYAIDVYRGSHIWIENNHFTGDLQGNPSEWALKDIHVAAASHVTIRNNTLIHGVPSDLHHGVVGIFLSSVSHVDVRDNELQYCGCDKAGRHQGGAIDLYNRCKNVNIVDNVLSECNYIGCRISRSTDILFERNYVAPQAEGYEDAVQVCSLSSTPTERVWIMDNVLRTAKNDGAGVYVVNTTNAAGYEPNEVYVLSNRIEGWHGVRSHWGCRGLRVMDNLIRANYYGIHCSEGAAVLSDAIIAGNHLDMSGNSSVPSVWVEGADTHVNGNTILKAHLGLALRIASGGCVNRNIIEASRYHVLLYNNNQDLVLSDNELIGEGKKYYRKSR